MKLTENLVLSKTRLDRLVHVKNLNVWGNEIDDLSVLRQMPNVEVLALSMNKICTLKEFAHCKKITELYLRRNDITAFEEVRHLKELAGLKILWLLENPIAAHPLYRQLIIHTLPQLEQLDQTVITDEERRAAASAVGPSETPAPRASSAQRGEPKEQASSAAAPSGRSRWSAPNVDIQLAGQVAPRSSRSKQQDDDDAEGANANNGYEEDVESASDNKTKESKQRVHSEGTRARSNSSASKGGMNHVLYAVLTLLNELDEAALSVISDDIDRRLSALRK